MKTCQGIYLICTLLFRRKILVNNTRLRNLKEKFHYHSKSVTLLENQNDTQSQQDNKFSVICKLFLCVGKGFFNKINTKTISWYKVYF